MSKMLTETSNDFKNDIQLNLQKKPYDFNEHDNK